MIKFAIFNNKGGVGKTTYLYHIAHILSEDANVLLVDCDSQCNLTAYCMQDNYIKNSWSEKGNSIFKCIELIYETTGDFRKRRPFSMKKDGSLHVVPGDLRLSEFEDRLGDTWNSARGGECCVT